MNLQTSLDLLGEIIKSNKRTLLLFESSISEPEFELICAKILSNIIDSNVFIRALAISLHKFNHVNNFVFSSIFISAIRSIAWRKVFHLFLSSQEASYSAS